MSVPPILREIPDRFESERFRHSTPDANPDGIRERTRNP